MMSLGGGPINDYPSWTSSTTGREGKGVNESRQQPREKEKRLKKREGERRTEGKNKRGPGRGRRSLQSRRKGSQSSITGGEGFIDRQNCIAKETRKGPEGGEERFISSARNL